MIPNRHHVLWFTDNALPDREQGWLDSWKIDNQELQLMFWDLPRILARAIPEICREMLSDNALHYVLKTDIARYLVLYIYGGVYHDTDVESCKSLQYFLGTDSFAALSCTPGIMGNAVIGSIPGNKLMRDIAIATAQKIKVDGVAESNANICDHGQNIAGKLLYESELILPAHYFYPFGSGGKRDYVPSDFPESFCLHHWTGMDSTGWYHTSKEKKA